MSAEDYLMYDLEYDQNCPEFDLELPKTCKYCGISPLFWKPPHEKEGWRLVNELGNIHKCKRKDT